MAVWKRIKQIRTDISDYVVHCTRGKGPVANLRAMEDAEFDSLKLILRDGFFKASFAKKPVMRDGYWRPTVRGPYPVVCFTEQPLQFLAKSVLAGRNRYTKFAIAVRKDELFYYGGRPVIYSDQSTLDLLPNELKYLWVHYNPTVIWKRSYPIDFTHEREWRARPNVVQNEAVGLGYQPQSILGEAVPIHLLDRGERLAQDPHFVILVATEEYRAQLAKWIHENVREIGKKGIYWKNYAVALASAAKTQILSFEKIQESKQSLGRVEDFLGTNI